MKIGTARNTCCLPNWLTCGLICCRQDIPPLPPIFLKHTRHSSRKLLDGELDGVWQDSKASRLQDTRQQTYKDLYPCICTFIGVLLTMPPTSATRESSFSGMKHLKNYLRTTMTDRLSSLAVIHVHKDMNNDVDQVINVFASEKCRKLDFF